MHSQELELLHRYLDDRLEPADIEPLQSLLRDSAEARRILRDLATVDGKLTELAIRSAAPVLSGETLASQEIPLPPLIHEPSIADRKRSRSAWRPLSGIALGLLIGAACSSVAWAYAVPRLLESSPKVTSLLLESFETKTAPEVTGLPSQIDQWSGDFSQLALAENGVLPASGNQMLRMLRADHEGKANPEGSYCGDLFRIVDLRPYRDAIARGKGVAELSVQLNAAVFPEQEQYRGSIAMHAITEEFLRELSPISRGDLTSSALAMGRQTCPQIDRDPATWQRIDCTLKVPAEADFLLIHIGIFHNPKFQNRVEFSGHYIDDIRLTMTQQ